ncbi:MAG: hypothetical protein ACI89D_001421 [Bermanella sp.]|jgi:hypothetical protein
MKRWTISFLSCLVLCVASVTAFAEAAIADWKLERDKDNVKVFTRDVEGSSIKAFRGETTIDAELNRALALMDDTAACVEWMHTCKSPVLIGRLNPLERYSYMVNDLPWPVTDRALLLRATISQNMLDRVVTVDLVSVAPEALSEQDKARLPSEKGVVLIEKAKGFFRFTPIDDQHTHVEYQMHTEPGGSLSASLVNSMLVDTPYYTLKSIQSVVLAEKYQDFRPF